ncbi:MULTISPECIES: PAS domain-containing sensor histidine kinase [unclassified Variovorax]|uniref:PAS domain-containing sensor histidine kinase n=2 Tax=Variovorax TaxID=34072 RepID=UPI000B81497F|nr:MULTISPECIES: PAS domain-containing sensor histidine kinase [unclassified Variovorax]
MTASNDAARAAEQPVSPAVAAVGIDPAMAAALLWEQSPDIAFVVLDTAGVITAWRGAAEALFGFSEEEISGSPIDVLFVEEDRVLGLPQLEREVAVSAHRSEDDRWHLRKDGARIWVTGSLIAIQQHGQHVGFVKVMADRTNLRARIETSENRLQIAQEKVQARDAFFGRLVHEVRNALGPMRIAAEIMEKRGLVVDELAKPASVVARQAVLVERMMADLADVVRVGVGKLTLFKSEFDLGAEIVDIADVVAADVEAKQQTIDVLVPPVAIPILADRQRVHQIVFNLLHNAIKYTPAKGKIWLRCTVEVNHAVIKVADTGIGIDAALLPVIFDLFTQEDPDRSGGGFGVGLSLVKDLVHAHGGFVEVRCDGKGQGSEFTVRLPLDGPSLPP